jgi:hypothetical protein
MPMVSSSQRLIPTEEPISPFRQPDRLRERRGDRHVSRFEQRHDSSCADTSVAVPSVESTAGYDHDHRDSVDPFVAGFRKSNEKDHAFISLKCLDSARLSCAQEKDHREACEGYDQTCPNQNPLCSRLLVISTPEREKPSTEKDKSQNRQGKLEEHIGMHALSPLGDSCPHPVRMGYDRNHGLRTPDGPAAIRQLISGEGQHLAARRYLCTCDIPHMRGRYQFPQQLSVRFPTIQFQESTARMHR